MANDTPKSEKGENPAPVAQLNENACRALRKLADRLEGEARDKVLAWCDELEVNPEFGGGP